MNTKHCPDCGTRMVKNKSHRLWYCQNPECGATAPLRRTPTKKPDMTACLGPVRLAWLRAHGGIQPWIKKQVDEAMEKESANGNASLPQAVE